MTPDFLLLSVAFVVTREDVGGDERHWERAVARSGCELVAAVQRVFWLSLCPSAVVVRVNKAVPAALRAVVVLAVKGTAFVNERLRCIVGCSP